MAWKRFPEPQAKDGQHDRNPGLDEPHGLAQGNSSNTMKRNNMHRYFDWCTHHRGERRTWP
jgi:hypothetical protein